MNPNAPLLLLAGALLLFTIGVWHYSQGSAQRAEVVARNRLVAGVPITRRLRLWFDARLAHTRLGRAVEARLAAGGVDVLAGEFVLLVIAVAITSYVVSSLIFPSLLALILSGMGVAACFGYLNYRRGRRIGEFVAQLPDLARVLSNASSAGFALPSAIGLAAAEVADPAQEVLQRVVEELRLGQSVETALASLDRRMPSREVALLVHTLVIQQRAGGDLVSALRDMATTLEGRKDLRREVKTIMAGAVYTSYLVPLLGLGSLLMLNQVSPDVLDRMVGSWPGRLALLTGLSLYAIGFALVRRTTRIET